MSVQEGTDDGTMVNLEPVWARARTDLLIPGEHGDPDVYLWEHSARVTAVAQKLARLPNFEGQAPDDAVIVAAGLYHEAGWAVRYSENAVKRTDILTRPPAESHRELGARFMEKRLTGLLPTETIERASLAISTLNDRDIPLLEGQILTEAENLEEFGLLSLWPAVRRGALDGKGVKAVLDTWRRRKEYQFWTARLNDSFRFPWVREIAKARLARFERFMEELQEQHEGADLIAPASSKGPLPSEPAYPNAVAAAKGNSN
jgi:hypothetical protein